MTASHSNFNPRRRAARFATIIMVFTALCIASASAQAPPYALFEYSTLTASTDTIVATQVPVVTASGTTYVNLTLQFNVAADGTITVTPGYPVIVPSQPYIVTNFMAGNYYGGNEQPGYEITVSGPGGVQGGSTEWSLTASSGSSGNTIPSNAFWYVVGNIQNSPIYARILKAKIDTQGWAAFGYIGDNNCYAGYCDAHWSTNTLLGFAQTGNQLAISSFTTTDAATGKQKDSSMAVDEITYCLNKPCGTN
jgi:hypothetical protein